MNLSPLIERHSQTEAILPPEYCGQGFYGYSGAAFRFASAPAGTDTTFGQELLDLRSDVLRYKKSIEGALASLEQSKAYALPSLEADAPPLSRVAICKLASCVLGYLLEQEGYDVRCVRACFGKTQPYPTIDHQLLLVRMRYDVIVDPSYLQFVRLLGVPLHSLRDTILVVPVSELGDKCRALARLRLLNPAETLLAPRLQHEGVIEEEVSFDPNQLEEHLMAVWDVRRPSHLISIEKHFTRAMRSFRTGDSFEGGDPATLGWCDHLNLFGK